MNSFLNFFLNPFILGSIGALTFVFLDIYKIIKRTNGYRIAYNNFKDFLFGKLIPLLMFSFLGGLIAHLHNISNTEYLESFTIGFGIIYFLNNLKKNHPDNKPSKVENDSD